MRLSGLELKRPRIFGSCWLACELWQQLGLDEFWQQRLPATGREAVSWEKVLRLLVVESVARSGQRVPCASAMVRGDSGLADELLETGFEVAEKDRLYRCLDRVLELISRNCSFTWKQKWADLFGADFEVLLYDLTRQSLFRG